MERWRKPAIPLAIEEEDTSVTIAGQTLRRGTNAVYSPEDLARFKEGRICFGHDGLCAEPFETPFPERCPLCGYPVRARQRRDIAISFDETHRRIGPSTTLDEEYDRLNDWADREYHDPKLGVVIEEKPSGLTVVRDAAPEH